MVTEEQILAWGCEHPRRDFEQYPELAGKGFDWCLTCRAKWPCPFMAMAASYRSLAARLGELRQMLVAIEWDDATDIQQCAWCMFGKQHGHDDGCQFAALLAAALAPGAGGEGR